MLWLLEGNAAAPRNLRREAAARGVAPERLVFAPRIEAADHLARHRLADLFLDTLPYNAHTTASDALWAGLPVLTCLGTTFAGRVAASLLQAIGLPELITHSLDEYEALALQLARDETRLFELKRKLAPIATGFRCSTPTAFGATSRRPTSRCGSASSAACRPPALRSLPIRHPASRRLRSLPDGRVPAANNWPTEAAISTIEGNLSRKFTYPMRSA